MNSLKTTILLTALCVPVLSLAWEGDGSGSDHEYLEYHEYYEYHEYREYNGDSQQPQQYEPAPIAEPTLANPCCGQNQLRYQYVQPCCGQHQQPYQNLQPCCSQNQQRYQFVPPIGEPAPGSNQPLYQDVPYQAYPQQQRQGYPFYERYERERWHCFKQR
ncbi:MAG: hypothetical protein U0103_17175 [Candidatus Obscuribacterales bacterium]|nr:MAG: hypothetical protein EKK48_17365 [Candidatus Melainabacteria bacterium]